MKKEFLTLMEAETFLKDKYGTEVNDICLLGSGEWSMAFGFTLDSKELVIRFGLHVDDYRKDEIMSRYSSQSLPIPLIIEIGTAPIGYFVISVRVQGQFIDTLSGEEMKKMIPVLLTGLNSAKNIDLSETKGFGGWDYTGNSQNASWAEALLKSLKDDDPERRIAGWSQKMDNAPESKKLFNKSLKTFEQLVQKCPNHRHIIHNDLLNRNVLVNNGSIVGFIDWGNSMYGDYLYDIALLIYWWPYYLEWKDIDIAEEAKTFFLEQGVSAEDFEMRIKCYLLDIGLEAQVYNSYQNDWNELEKNAKRTWEIANSL